jgi:hypothetical protein
MKTGPEPGVSREGQSATPARGPIRCLLRRHPSSQRAIFDRCANAVRRNEARARKVRDGFTSAPAISRAVLIDRAVKRRHSRLAVAIAALRAIDRGAYDAREDSCRPAAGSRTEHHVAIPEELRASLLFGAINARGTRRMGGRA